MHKKIGLYLATGLAIIIAIVTPSLIIVDEYNLSSHMSLFVFVGMMIVAHYWLHRISDSPNIYREVAVSVLGVVGVFAVFLATYGNSGWKMAGFALLGISSAILSAIVGVIALQDYNKQKLMKMYWALAIGSGIMIVIGAIILGVCELRHKSGSIWLNMCESPELVSASGYTIIFITVPFLGASIQNMIKKYI